MFVRMTRSVRIWTGWLIALGYLVCVLAPGTALALGIGPTPCFDLNLPVAAAPMNMHDDGAMHDHMMHAQHHADGSEQSTHHHHESKASFGPCCAMMCIAVLASTLPAVVAPSQPVSSCTTEADLSLPGKAPPLLYRPPIRLS